MVMKWPWVRAKGEGRGFTTVQNDLTGGALFRGPLTAPFSVSKATANSVVASCLQWSNDNIIEPDLVAFESKGGKSQPVESPGWAGFGKSHDVYRMIQILVQSLNLDGNAYLVKHRDGRGNVVGVDAIPFVYVDPRMTSGRTAIERYQIGGESYLPEDVIHFKRWVDSENHLMGCSAIKSTMREILTDSEIAAYMHRIVKSPTPGLLVSVNQEYLASEDKAALEALAESKFSGENVGKPMVYNGDIKIQTAGFSPADLAVDKLSKLPEQRITGAFGIPPVVVGVGAGIDNMTYDNLRTSMYKATTDHLIPLWQLIERQLTRELLPFVDSRPARTLNFDLSMVKALSIDLSDEFDRVDMIWRSGMVDRKTALDMLNLPFEDSDAGVWYWQLSPASSAATLGTRSLRRRY